MLTPADSKEQIAEFNADGEAYTQYARDVEGELNKRFTLVSDSTPILVLLALALGLWLCHSLCFRFSYTRLSAHPLARLILHFLLHSDRCSLLNLSHACSFAFFMLSHVLHDLLPASQYGWWLLVTPEISSASSLSFPLMFVALVLLAGSHLASYLSLVSRSSSSTR
jgi:hypothetical protein